MKKLPSALRIGLVMAFILLIHPGFVQPESQKSYDELWSEIESLTQKGLPKSAVQVLETVQMKAIAENNSPQLLKTTLYRFSLMQSYEEDNLLKSIELGEEQLLVLQSPARELLHSILAELYWFYYQQNQYLFLERTNLESNNAADPREWDLDKMRMTIADHYKSSLREQNLMDTIPLKKYEVILTTNKKESFLLQPTLFDFVATRALEYYLNSDAALKEIAPSTTLNNLKWWQPATIFTTLSLPQGEHQQLIVLDLFQKLQVSNLRQKHTDALIANEIKRYEFLRNNYKGPENNDSLYFSALTKLQERYQNVAASAEVAALRAGFLINQSPINEKSSDTTQFNLSRALEICDLAIKTFPESRGAALCMGHRQQILQKDISVSVQRVETPTTPIAAKLSYRNITNPAFRVVKTTSEELEKLMNIMDQSERLKAFIKLQPLHSWQIELPFEVDYLSHTTIIDLPALETGLYVLLVSDTEQFNPNGFVSFTSFQVSNLSFISLKRNDNNQFFLLHRDTGKPIKGADIRIMVREYNYTDRRYLVSEKLRLESDNKGSFIVSANDQIAQNQAFYIEAMFKGDTLYSDNYFDLYKTRINERKQLKTWFFTDRAIYRPGQVVYFKGITLEKQGNEDWQIIENQSTEVKFYDVNNREIGTRKLKTNAFGSIEGSFTSPTGTLNGNMRISNENGTVMIAVEEYKRPSFEVVLEATNKQLRLNDTVVLKGEAKAFAGYGLDSVELNYRVEREVYLPFWPYWRRFPAYGQNKVLIANGHSKTDGSGNFTVKFNALPDAAGKLNDYPVYSYTVTVDVIDRNGETRRGIKIIQVSDVALILRTNIKDVVTQQNAAAFKMSAVNLQQIDVPAQVEVKFYKLKRAERLTRPELWPQTDRNFHSAEKLLELFPLDNFEGLMDDAKREKTLVYSQKRYINVPAQLFPEETTQWSDGEYLIELSASDTSGKEVKLEQRFTFFDEKSKTLPVNELAWFYVNKNSAEPGDTIVFQLGSAAKGTKAMVEILSGNEVIQSRWITINKKKLTLPFIVKEEHRGGLRFQAVFVRHNRLEQCAYDVSVPFTNKVLDIEIETKRDKLLPGSEETWNLKISGMNKEKLTAELLASMYDASLDQFKANEWQFDLLLNKRPTQHWSADNGFQTYTTSMLSSGIYPNFPDITIEEPSLNWFGLQLRHLYRNDHIMKSMAMAQPEHESHHGVELLDVLVNEGITPPALPVNQQTEQITAPKIRSDFRETAFFYPQLTTDNNGFVTVSFKLPDALTKWKLMLLAHTKDLKTGNKTFHFTASKELMIAPNQPRYYREGDTAWVSAKVVNTGSDTITGIARLEIIDAVTRNPLAYFIGNQIQKPFLNLKPGQSQEVKWKIHAGNQSSLIALRFSAVAGVFTDSEEQLVPVLPSRILVTESMSMHVKGLSNGKFEFKNLKEPGKNEQNQRLNLQFSSNPAWYAVQALPYIYESNLEYIDNTFNRLYANSLASMIANSIPKVMQVIDSWKAAGSDAFISNLEKNKEMKAVLLSETPWVLETSDESQQKKNITLLFDLNRMRYEQDQAIRKLQESQLPDGSWPWFAGMKGNRYTTQNIVSGMGRLQQLGAINAIDSRHAAMFTNAIQYLDKEALADYNYILKEKFEKTYLLRADHLNYLYGRSFYAGRSIDAKTQLAFDFFLEHTVKDWLKLNNGQQAMAALVLFRNGRIIEAKAILASLRERAIINTDLGVYWKQEQSYYWYQAPVENQALLISAFDEIENDSNWIDQLRLWLLTQKQTNKWNTSRATADAVYALLLNGSDWLEESSPLNIIVGGKTIEPESVEAGTGLITKDWFTTAITPELAEIEITNPNKVLAWGAMFRQYFVPLDEVRANQTQLKISKELYVETAGKQGIVLVPVEKSAIKVGDRIKVRIILESDRDMEFVHLKDQRAAAFEPTEVLSGVQYHFGLGYYQSVRDASVDYFFDTLPKGKYVFEYSLAVMQSGDFTNGYALIQSFYAPEFSSHSAGLRVKIGE